VTQVALQVPEVPLSCRCVAAQELLLQSTWLN
jgi:hypothetical protein